MGKIIRYIELKVAWLSSIFCGAKFLFSFAIIFFLSSCATTELTKGGRLVREINIDWQNECKFLGYETVYESPFSARGTGNIKMRNKVYELGGNAYIKKSWIPIFGKWELNFEAYKCKEYEVI
ncbi:hypothetical protein [Caedibacter taeniospiralis]|uniref:hypothetical protein n=1 Tax=Caedibacter taeniospiralis TaxID=28907 RepID=UPI000C279488|nr:hypothetical protein [Caedibacter taeniospiralis]